MRGLSMTSDLPNYASVLDAGTVLTFGYDDCVRYHGRTSIGGVALGFRLMQRAIAELSPDGPPDRTAISIRTAFPGEGVRDAVEMITRAVTRGAYVVDLNAAPPSAPAAAKGRLWFEVAIGGNRRAYAVRDGAMSGEFIGLARKSHAEGLSVAEAARWVALKEELAATIMSLRPDDVLLPA
jgi:hypothetical protein